MKKKIFAILILSIVLILALIGCDINVEKRQLATGDDSKLKTLILTDIRFDGSAADEVRKSMITKMIEQQQPEFIAIAGNIVNTENNGKMMKEAVAFIDGFDIPWATSIGELDVKGKTSKKGIMQILTDKKLKNSMVMRGENYGYSYILEVVKSNKKVNNLFYFVDTSIDCTDAFVDWYKNSLANLSIKYVDIHGNLLASHIFMNKPLPIYDANKEMENIDVHPWTNSLIFQNAIINSKSTKAVMAGYDDLTNGTKYRGEGDIQFMYIKSMLFDSTMTGSKYDSQKSKTGCSWYEFSDSTYINISNTYYGPNEFVGK